MTVNQDASEVSVVMSLINNPGIMGMPISMDINDDVFAFKSASKGAALPSVILTPPGKEQTTAPCNFLMDAGDLTNDDKSVAKLRKNA